MSYLTYQGKKIKMGVSASALLNTPSLSNGVISYWKMEEADGATLYDVKGVNNCTYQDVSLGQPGKIGNGVQFNAASGAVMMPSTMKNYFQTSPFSFSLWIKVDTLPSTLGRGEGIFFIGGSGPGSGLGLQFGNYGGNYFQFYAYDVSENKNTIEGRVTMISDISAYMHYVCTYEGKGGILSMYYNGTLDATSNIISKDLATLGVLHTMGNTSQYNTSAFDGTLDEVGVWNRALSAKEVRQLYNIGRGNTYPFIPEIVEEPDILFDGSTAAWHSIEDIYITKNASNLVSQWNDRSGNNRHLTAPLDAYKPVWTPNDGLYLSGKEIRATYTISAQPICYYMLMNIVNHGQNDILMYNNDNPADFMFQTDAGTHLAMKAGGATAINLDYVGNTFAVYQLLYNEASSKFRFNTNAAQTFTLGQQGTSSLQIGMGDDSSFNIKEVIVRVANDSSENQLRIINYLDKKYKLNLMPSSLYDGNTVAWYRSDVLSTLTRSDVSISKWADYLGSGKDLDASTNGATWPILTSEGVLFDGVNDYMLASAINQAQPIFIYVAIKQVTYTIDAAVFSDTVGTTRFKQTGPSPTLGLYAGMWSLYDNKLQVGNWGILRLLMNQANSKVQMYKKSITYGDSGAFGFNGFRISSYTEPANIQIKELIIRSSSDVNNEEEIYNYLSKKYNIY